MREFLKRLAGMGLWTFLTAIVVAYLTTSVLANVGLIPAFLLLFGIVVVNILADIVGTAAAAASEAPFNAMAANKVAGAKEALWLAKNADRVSNVMNDLLGDVFGTINGAISAAIVLRLVSGRPESQNLASTLLLGFVAALTVGGKAGAKLIAINNSTNVLHQVGRVLSALPFFANGSRNNNSRPNGSRHASRRHGKKRRR